MTHMIELAGHSLVTPESVAGEVFENANADGQGFDARVAAAKDRLRRRRGSLPERRSDTRNRPRRDAVVVVAQKFGRQFLVLIAFGCGEGACGERMRQRQGKSCDLTIPDQHEGLRAEIERYLPPIIDQQSVGLGRPRC